MADLEIPTRKDVTKFRQVVELEQVNYVLFFRFNFTAGYWEMDIATAQGVAIISGVPLLRGVLLTQDYTDSQLPPGKFVVYSTAAPGVEPGETDLGDTARLIYRPTV